MDYYIIYNGQSIGPMAKDTLLSYGLNPNSQIWTKGMANWAPAYTVPELMQLINAHNASNPPSYTGPQQPFVSVNSVSGKSNVAFGLFAIFLGCFGVQYFYIGKTTGGILCLLIYWLSCGLWSIVCLIQGILALTMSPDQFEQKFVNSPSSFPIFP